MAESKVTIQVNVEGLLQKELVKVVTKLYEDHGVMINDINFQWEMVNLSGDAMILRCDTSSSYSTLWRRKDTAM